LNRSAQALAQGDWSQLVVNRTDEIALSAVQSYGGTTAGVVCVTAGQ
jgi:hypothetical protein